MYIGAAVNKQNNSNLSYVLGSTMIGEVFTQERIHYIKGTDGRYYYYGHLSEIRVKSGQSVKITDVIGIEGSTGRSTGSHCHYCIQRNFCKGNSFNVSEISGIPNCEGGTYDDGFRTGMASQVKKSVNVTIVIEGVTYQGTLTEK